MTTNIVPLRPLNDLEQLVVEIRGHLYDAKGAEAKFNKHRLAAGQKLLELRRRVESGEAGEGVNWWEWFDKADVGRSRRDAERLMAMARSDDPEAALAKEQEKTREAVRAHRERVSDLRKSESEEYDIVEHALNLIAKMSEEQREEFEQLYMEKYNG